jgi:hypothetical protein
MKKIVLIVIILTILSFGGFLAYKKMASKKQESQSKVVQKKKPEVNLIELAKRPYVTLTPRADGHEVSMTIDGLKLKETNLEYEMEYQAGSMLQGAGGRIDFKEEKPPVSKNLLFGSCSKGKCKYDDDVSSGSLTLYFSGSEDYGLKGDFTIAKMEEAEGVFNSRDVKVSLNVGKEGLDDDVFVVVLYTMGLPGVVKGEVLAGPYGFFTAQKQSIKKAELTFKTSQEGDLKILGWNGNDWQEYETVSADGLISASVDKLTTFVLVK